MGDVDTIRALEAQLEEARRERTRLNDFIKFQDDGRQVLRRALEAIQQIDGRGIIGDIARRALAAPTDHCGPTAK